MKIKNIKKILVCAVGVFLIITSLLVLEFRKSIFQCGNPIPYIEKIMILNEDKKFAKVYDDKDIYITLKSEYNDLHKYIERKYNVVFFEQMGSGYIFISSNKRIILSSEIYWSKYEVWKIEEKEDNISLDELSINRLKEIRDKSIDKNLKDIGELNEDEAKNSKDLILNPKWQSGLVAFINNNYDDLTEKEKLIKEIKIIDYANLLGDRMDPSGIYFEVMNESYQISEYLVKNNKDSNIGTYENLKFIIQNIEHVVNFVDYDVRTLILTIKPEFYESLSESEKKSLNEEFKKIYNDANLNLEIKKEIKRIIIDED